MHNKQALRPPLVIAALGVVFGDIGTSPIYTLQTVFNPGDPHPVPISETHVYGVVSLIFWSVMLIVTLTYVSLVMRADNDGEGGVMALITLVRRCCPAGHERKAAVLSGLGLFGAALFFGDSMITPPAISVLSSIEGLKVIEPEFDRWVIPLTVVIIVALFSVQRRGTENIGRFFGPVMIAWFSGIGACGIGGIVAHPDILRALSPTYAWVHGRALPHRLLCVGGRGALGHRRRGALCGYGPLRPTRHRHGVAGVGAARLCAELLWPGRVVVG